jgi:hypothetical protein
LDESTSYERPPGCIIGGRHDRTARSRQNASVPAPWGARRSRHLKVNRPLQRRPALVTCGAFG